MRRLSDLSSQDLLVEQVLHLKGEIANFYFLTLPTCFPFSLF